MKVLKRLNLIPTTAAVKDIPADLRALIDSEMGMKQFTEWLYSSTYKDLNALEMSKDVFTKTKKITSKDFGKANAGEECLIIQLYEDKHPLGLLFICGGYFRFYDKKKKLDTFYLQGAPLDIHSSRNIVRILNDPHITFNAWIIDLSKAEDTTALRRERYEAQQGIIKRYANQFIRTDKSGYEVDKDKYKDMLRELKRAGNVYMDRIAKESARFFDLQSQIAKAGKTDNLSWKTNNVIEDLKDALTKSVAYYADPKYINQSIDKFAKSIDELRTAFKK